MLSKVFSGAVYGIDAYIIVVEIDLDTGLPFYTTVGLPDAAVKESRERVLAALKNSGFDIPLKRIVVNLAPADIKKEGSYFDLPIALGILAASGIIPKESLASNLVLGELSLDGRVKPIRGTLAITMAAKKAGFSDILLPCENAEEAAIVEGICVYPIKSLLQAVDFLTAKTKIEAVKVDVEEIFSRCSKNSVDFADVKSQYHAKRAIEIAAAGGHNIIMIGPPGSGKSMLAKRIPTILPQLNLQESTETTKIHSISGTIPKNTPLIVNRPFRSPHHTISDAGLIGGGQFPMPGEVSLAHNGVLFLDEMPEFKRNVLEVLRQPLEEGSVTISRASGSLTFPARFMLAAALNPCPCGNKFSQKECFCSPLQINRYLGKISGPLLDRIDIHIEVPSVKYKDIEEIESGESSEAIRKRVQQARIVQWNRFNGDSFYCNAHMTTKHIKSFCKLDMESKTILGKAIDKMGLSVRAYDRILKVARTISDLEGSSNITSQAVLEAIQYRTLDRNFS